MGLTTAHALLDGTLVGVDHDVLDIGRRIREGDPLVGWVGDDKMGLFVDNERFIGQGLVNPEFGWFEVWGLDAAGEPYLALKSATCDERMLERLRDGHWSNEKRGQQRIDAALAVRAEKERAAREARQETMDKLHFALRKDIGAHVGGLTKRYH